MHISTNKKPCYLKLLPAFALSALSPLLALAEENAAFLTEDDFLAEIPVVLSVTRLAQRRSDAPASITIIDRDMIAASGIKEIPMLLRLVPGFQAGHDYGSLLAPRQTPVTYMGYSDALSRKMQVLIDGRSVYDPMYGGVRWTELGLALEDIERIEVIRGPNAASYGSNAFLGAINIITRDPTLESGTVVSGGGFSDGQRQATVRHSSSGGKTSYRMTAGYSVDEGFSNLNDSKNTTALAYRGDTRLSSRDTLSVHFGVSQGLRQMGDGTGYLLNPDHDAFVNNHYQQVKWSRRESADSELSVQLYHNYFQVDNHYVGYPTGAAVSATDVNSDNRSHRWNLELQHTLRTSTNSRLVWGGEIRQDEVTAPAWFTSTDWKRIQLYRLFANGEWNPGSRWTINSGLMVENSSATGVAFSPRLAANYHLNPVSTFRGAISRANRNPSLFEQYAYTALKVGGLVVPPGTTVLYFYGGGNVKPETIDSVELVYIFDDASRNLFFDAKAFYMQFRDSIAYPGGGATGATYTYYNGGESSIYGLEFQLKKRIGKKTTATASYAYAWHDGWYVNHLTTAPLRGDSDRSTPNHTLSFLVDHKFGPLWRGGLFYYYVSDFSWFGGSDTDYHVANVRLAHKFRPGSRSAEIELIGQNLLGRYYDFHNTAVSDRRFYLGLKMPL